MINRTMVRTKVMQTLFAYYKTGDMTPLSAKKALLNSCSDTYNLYMMLLALPDELVTLAQQQIEADEEKAKVLHEAYTAKINFVNNRLAGQLFNNRTLRTYLSDQHLAWDMADQSIRKLFRQLTEQEYYQAYLNLDAPTYEDDKMIWRKIYSELLPDNEWLETGLEELELHLDQHNWVTDLNVVLSYVFKTVKRYEENSTNEQALLEMFDSEDELTFAKDLLRYSIERSDEINEMIDAHLKNWDANRVAYMDRIIMHVALAEILSFPTIALQVSMNEYIEMAKEYSSEKSHSFINGILDEIIKGLKKENKLIKAVVLD